MHNATAIKPMMSTLESEMPYKSGVYRNTLTLNSSEDNGHRKRYPGVNTNASSNKWAAKPAPAKRNESLNRMPALCNRDVSSQKTMGTIL